MMTVSVKHTVWILLLLIVPTAESKRIEYQAGQVWKTQGGPAIVTILKVEDLPKVGKVVHIRIDNLPMVGCEGLAVGGSIQHLAFKERMLRSGLVDLIKENADLPDSYFDEYRRWEQQENHLLLKVPIQQVIRGAEFPGPIICNFLPRET